MGLLGSGELANTWTCTTCGAVYHDMRAVRRHARAGDGHTLFTASRTAVGVSGTNEQGGDQ
jgi:hypothetical protein